MLGANRYGKSNVRVMKVVREAEVHHVFEWTVQILVEGDFTACFVEGDNRQILPTDTMKNAVYAQARTSDAQTMEAFALELALFLLEGNPQIQRLDVDIAEKGWERIEDQPAAFRQSGPEQAATSVRVSREADPVVVSGVLGLVILKTADSGFRDFKRDGLTTLPDTDDRLLCTEADIHWKYNPRAIEYRSTRRRIVDTLLSTFAEHKSASVQHTLYAMGEAVLASEPDVCELEMTMPNRHCLLVNLAPFGQDNPNEIYVPTDEPHGTIQAKIVREG